MSPRPRRLSGPEVISIFCHLGFEIQSQRGSHVKLRRQGAKGEKQTLTIPQHAELDPGTLRAIIRQASRYIPEEQLHPLFLSE